MKVAFLLFRNLFPQKVVGRSRRTRSERAEWRGRPSILRISFFVRHLPPRRNTTPYISRVFALRRPTRSRFQAVKLRSQLVFRLARDWLQGRFQGTDSSLAKMIRDGNLITRKGSGLLPRQLFQANFLFKYWAKGSLAFESFDFLHLTVFISSHGEPEAYGVGREKI